MAYTLLILILIIIKFPPPSPLPHLPHPPAIHILHVLQLDTDSLYTFTCNTANKQFNVLKPFILLRSFRTE